MAVVMEPGNRFLYPAMGMRLERRATYVNVNRADLGNAGDYPRCNPRVDPQPEAWLENLAEAGVRWVHVGRQPGHDFPWEAGVAEASPGRLTLRYQDPGNRIYEVLAR